MCKGHTFAPYFHRESTPKDSRCSEHTHENCEHYCEQCDIHVCSTCVSSSKHGDHDISDILGNLNSKSLQKDLQELETTIYPRYKEMVSEVQIEKSRVRGDVRETDNNC